MTETTKLDPQRDELEELWVLCREFIEDLEISCPEKTADDRVYEYAPELVEAICEIVGYHKYKDEEND